ncbi:hypothetical protein DQ04_01161080 [Trypanosoma grayi]|uniref:hypothetical protein n=1 Tax=Trypanosoma grayi TaxID=71804 RepID=UPI0004F44648|nr:hypothetical protein DQ04_01161080 [Trypanosoma grayi]KEG13190.1 hypothetical protein DQ04_01161080 [Trypanosoma grayi]
MPGGLLPPGEAPPDVSEENVDERTDARSVERDVDATVSAGSMTYLPLHLPPEHTTPPRIAGNPDRTARLNRSEVVSVAVAPVPLTGGTTEPTTTAATGMENTKYEGWAARQLSSEEMQGLSGEFLSFLQGEFDTVYNTAVEQTKQGKANTSGQEINELVIAYRQQQQPVYEAELESRRQEFAVQLQEEQRLLRQTSYQRQAEALRAQHKEKRAEYQNLLEQYYACREEARVKCASLFLHHDSQNMRFTSTEAAALRTPAESMQKEQLKHLRQVLQQLQLKLPSAEHEARRCSSRREMAVSSAAARVQRQYINIISEQHQEIKMLQHWRDAMRRLERNAEESIAANAEQLRQRQEYLQREEVHQLPSPVIAAQDGSVATPEQRGCFRKGLFDDLL